MLQVIVCNDIGSPVDSKPLGVITAAEGDACA